MLDLAVEGSDSLLAAVTLDTVDDSLSGSVRLYEVGCLWMGSTCSTFTGPAALPGPAGLLAVCRLMQANPPTTMADTSHMIWAQPCNALLTLQVGRRRIADDSDGDDDDDEDEDEEVGGAGSFCVPLCGRTMHVQEWG